MTSRQLATIKTAAKSLQRLCDRHGIGNQAQRHVDAILGEVGVATIASAFAASFVRTDKNKELLCSHISTGLKELVALVAFVKSCDSNAAERALKLWSALGALQNTAGVLMEVVEPEPEVQS